MLCLRLFFLGSIRHTLIQCDDPRYFYKIRYLIQSHLKVNSFFGEELPYMQSEAEKAERVILMDR